MCTGAGAAVTATSAFLGQHLTFFLCSPDTCFRFLVGSIVHCYIETLLGNIQGKVLRQQQPWQLLIQVTNEA